MGKAYPVHKMRFIENGKGAPPLLILHGWGSSPDVFSKIMQPVSVYRQIFAPALPGFGGSEPPGEPWGSRDYVECIKEWTDLKNLDRFDLIGHSHGGRISIGLASKHPEKINRLILIGSAGLIVPKSLKTRMKIRTAKMLNLAGKIFGGKVRQRLNQLKQKLGSADWQSSSGVMRRTLSRVVNEDLSEDLKNINASTMLIWGENDAAVPPGLGRKMADLIPNSDFKLIKNAGHYCFLDKESETLSHIWKHLELPQAW